MKHYIFYTTEGYTFSPNYDDIENCQILAFEDAIDEKSAYDLFYQHYYVHIIKQGFFMEKVVCREIIL